MKTWIRFYHDPAIGFPRIGWAVRFMRSSMRGFGVFNLKWDGFHVALWWARRIEFVRIPKA